MNSATLTPQWLREPRENGVIPLSASLGCMLADAIEIADSAARSDIECHCRKRIGWYDLASVDPEDDWARDAIPRAVRYLWARGKIERAGELVRMVGAA